MKISQTLETPKSFESGYEINKRLIDIYTDNNSQWDNNNVSKLLGFIASSFAFIARTESCTKEVRAFCNSNLNEIKELKNEMIQKGGQK